MVGQGDEEHLAEQECRHGLMLDWCSLCKAPSPPARRGFRRGGSDFGVLAEHDGICAWCQEPIVAGEDRIAYDEMAPGWKHTVCP